MKISDELIGKHVIDESGDQIGRVNYLGWDFKTNTVISIHLKETEISAKIGLGNKKIVSYEKIEAIGNTVLSLQIFKTE